MRPCVRGSAARQQGWGLQAFLSRGPAGRMHDSALMISLLLAMLVVDSNSHGSLWII